jgi:hypothetical protein
VNRKKLWLLILTTVILTSFISGCIGGGQFGAPSADSTVTIKGVVVAPDNDCFTDTCSNPSIIEGEPLPNADIILKGNNGQTLTGKTDCAGNYQISGLTDDGYILYANRGEVWIKKALSPVTGDGGEANYITTAQVILWEVIENTNPGAIAIKDIPTAIPFDAIPQEFIDAVKAALADCRDAQQDPTVINIAKSYVNANFGAPCQPCVNPTPQPTPTPVPGCVDDPPEADFTINYIQADGGYQVSVSLGSVKNVQNYSWQFNNGFTSTDQDPGSQFYSYEFFNQNGISITLMVTNKCNESLTVNKSAGIVCPPLPSLVLTTNPEPGQDSKVHVTDTGSGANVAFSVSPYTPADFNYQWYLDGTLQNGQTGQTFNHSFSYNQGGSNSHTVKVTATSKCNGTSTDVQIEVVVESCPPLPSLVLTTNPEPGQDSKVHVTDTGSGANVAFSVSPYTPADFNYQWYLDGTLQNGQTGQTFNHSFSYNQGGSNSHTVKVTATSKCNGTATDVQIDIKVEKGCIPADISDFNVTSECNCPVYKSRCPDCEECEECTITISNVTTSGNNLEYKYGYARQKHNGWETVTWSNWTTNSNFTFTAIGECDNSKNYKIIVQVKNECGNDSKEKVVTLNGGQCEEECEECNRSDSNNCYKIISSSSYNSIFDQTTFTYEVKKIGSGSNCQDISHWVIDFGKKIPKDKIESKSGGEYTGKNEPTGVGKDQGIKWENKGGTFTVVIKGCVEATSGFNDAGKIKAGQGVFSLNVCQPDI